MKAIGPDGAGGHSPRRRVLMGVQKAERPGVGPLVMVSCEYVWPKIEPQIETAEGAWGPGSGER